MPAAAQVTPPAPEAEAPADSVLRLEDVVSFVEEAYPPLLIARLDRALSEGRLRSARGVFDLDIFAKAGGVVDGYYEYTEAEAGLEQFLGVWGSTVYGGYRLVTRDSLPSYYRNRTFEDGELAFGLSIPFLKGGPLDARRAEVQRAELELEAVGPDIARQRLDILRSATVAYYKWVAAGRTLEFARQLLQLANDRTAALEAQVATGLRPEIDLTDNQRLVLSREIGVIEAERDFLAAGVMLSLFLRGSGPEGESEIPGEERLPPQIEVPPFDVPDIDAGVALAIERRPELVTLALEVAREEVALRLARVDLLPSLDARIEATRDFGARLYGDLARDELSAALEFKLPLQRREAGGKEIQAQTKVEQKRTALLFARDRVAAEVRATGATLLAALDQTDRAELAADLADQLRAAEQERFDQGASDLLALQIREQAAFDALVTLVKTRLDLATALADWRVAIAEGLEVVPPEN
jgi:outer membrane protein TolC